MLVVIAGACSRSRSEAPEPTRFERATPELPAPTPDDDGDDCADVGSARVCWSNAGVHAVPRPLLAADYRCSGVGANRVCEPRRATSDPLLCRAGVCTQRYPRLPDDGEWECADLDGVVVCHGGEPAAGVVPARPSRGWFCGPRHGRENERVCVDFSPDRASDEPWSCRFQYEPGAATRLCTRGGSGALGRACGAGCPFGSVCKNDRCLPLRPEPACWLDGDCGKGQKCAYGSCREAPR